MQEPNLFKYSDYRQYLQDFYLYQKANRGSYTYEMFSRKAQIKSPNFLKLVIDNNKNLTNKTLLLFAEALSLSELEKNYFEALVFENQSESSIEKKYYASRLKTLKPVKEHSRPIRVTSKMCLFEDRLTPVILSLAVGELHASALQKIHNQLGVPIPKLERLLSQFLEHKVLEKSNDTYACNFDHAIFHETPDNIQLKKYIQSHLRLSQKAFDTKFSKEAKFFAHDMAINAEDYPKLIDEIHRFIMQINQNFDRIPGEKGVSINIQSFWLDRDLVVD